MLHIFTDKHSIGGTKTWVSTICKGFDYLGIQYKIYKNDRDVVLSDGSIVILNNCFDIDITKYTNAKIYFIVHSDICPYNSVLMKNINIISSVICVSQSIKNKLQKKLLSLNSNIKIHCLPNYVEKKSIQKEYSSEIVFSFVGRISPEKNLPMLLYSLSKLCVEWKLNIYGESLSEKYSNMVKDVVKSLNISDRVVFNGYVADKNIFYKKCNYMILPSISEGSSYSILEALSYGVPVIACSEVGDNSTLVTDGVNGYLASLKSACVEIPNLSDKLEVYTNNYTNILKNIGYIQSMMFDKSIKARKNKSTIIIPPNFCNRKVDIFDENVDILKNTLEKAIQNKLTIESQIFINHDEYIDKIKQIFGFVENIEIENIEIENSVIDTISVVVPTYNRRDKIVSTLVSLKNQTIENPIEIIIVDDGSTDNLYEYLQTTNIVPHKYVRIDENTGCWNARNIGIHHATGKYIVFHDSDDISDPNRLEIQYQLMKEMNLLACGTIMYRTHIESFGNVLDFETINAQIEKDKKNHSIHHNLQCCKKILGFATFMFKREVFETIGQFSKMVKGTDADFLIRYMIHYENVHYKNHFYLHTYLTDNALGKTYYITPNVLYYSSEFDAQNLTNM